MTPKATGAEQRPAATQSLRGGDDGEAPAGAQPGLGLTAKIGIGFAFVGVVGVVAMRAGTGPALLLLAATALLMVIWSAFRAVQGVVEPAEDLVSLAAKTTQAEAWKKAALKAIKDLEYERAIGNVSDDDYAKLLDTYREEAKRALRAVDDERKARREAAAEWIADHLTGGPEGDDQASHDAREDDEDGEEPPAKISPQADEETESESAAEPDPTPTPAEAPVSKREQRKCPKCETRNEVDAKFCKECATALPRGGA